MKQLFALISGLIFGFGLILPGMSNPAKVLNFLDVFGTWDPSLAFVMGGAIAVTAPGFAWLTRSRSRPFFDTRFRMPDRTGLDPKLLSGAVLFGTGWGLSGFCPGPALTALPIAATGTLIFVPFMLAACGLPDTPPTSPRPSAKELCDERPPEKPRRAPFAIDRRRQPGRLGHLRAGHRVDPMWIWGLLILVLLILAILALVKYLRK